jgi:hypothetical protein
MIHYKPISARVKELSDAGEGSAVIATLNVVDKDDDVTLPGAFGAQVAQVIPGHDWQHVPIGNTRIREVGNDVLADFRLNMGVAAAKDWHAALKFDLKSGANLQEWSYGFSILDSSQGQHEGRQVRFLKALKVYEISPVLRGAGEGTRTLAMKGRQFAEQIEAVTADVRDVIRRAEQLKELRSEEGRKLSPERVAQLKALSQEIGAFLKLCEAAANEAVKSEPDAAAERALADFMHTRQQDIHRRARRIVASP